MRTRRLFAFLLSASLLAAAACQSPAPSSPFGTGEHFAEVSLQFES